MVGGPIAALICLFLLPTEYTAADGTLVLFTAAGRTTLAIMVWMAVWWLTEAMHISVTALLPLAVFPLFGVASMDEAAVPYANKLIFLFFGGFMLALSMQRWGLDRRIALMTLSRIGVQPAMMIAGFMLVTAFLSAFVSNTATTAMMLPIALSVIGLLDTNKKDPDADEHAEDDQTAVDAAPEEEKNSTRAAHNFSTCLLLGIAYAASVGGVATIIGTPPNAVLVGFLRDTIDEPHRLDISMASWLLFGVPLAVVFLPIVWLLLTRFLFPVRDLKIAGARQLIQSQLQGLGTAGRGERITFCVFIVTATTWIMRPWLVKWTLPVADGWRPLAGLSDAGIAMLAAIALFVIPVNIREVKFTLNWETARRAPWGILILFGGGLSLAAAVKDNGVAEFIGNQATFFSGAPTIVIVLIVCTAVIFLTELTSNVATTATLVPVLAAVAPGLELHPYWLIFPATLSASFAFMLPVATPPNAIVFGSGHVSIAQMAKAGLWLNLIGILVITALTMLVIGPLLGI